MVANLIRKNNQTIVSLSDAKSHLRILHSHEDFYIGALLSVITASIENELDRDLVDTEYKLSIFSQVAVGEQIMFPNSPVYSVTDVQFFNGATEIEEGFAYTNSDEYIVFSELPAEYTSIVITYKKGFENAADVPTPIKQAALLMLSDLYLFRGSLVIGKSVVVLEKTIQSLLQPYKNVNFF
jgi:uncharacterized phiE125 gp8 family phage protein